MKIAFCCDHLIQRELFTEILELLLLGYKDAEIYTLTHNPKQLIANLRHHCIHSTFLSHKIKDIEDFDRYAYLIPSASKGLRIPCSFDFAVHFDSGRGFAPKVCEKTKIVTYFIPSLKTQARLDIKIKESFKTRFFKEYLTRCKKKTRLKSNIFLVPEGLELSAFTDWNVLNYKTLRLPIPVMSTKKRDFTKEKNNRAFVILQSQCFSCKELEPFVSDLLDRNYKTFLIGEDKHLQEIRPILNKKANANIFLGSLCKSELFELFLQSIVYVDDISHANPSYAVRAIHAGCRVVACKFMHFKQYLPIEGIRELKDYRLNELQFLIAYYKLNEIEIIQNVNLESKFSAERFKINFKKILEGEGGGGVC